LIFYLENLFYLYSFKFIFCEKKRVYNDLGVGILRNAWEGYNTSLFAYGQTGSGKSYSIVGYGVNKGIMPNFCEQIFKKIKSEKVEGTTYEVFIN
jgi:kinesin family member 1